MDRRRLLRLATALPLLAASGAAHAVAGGGGGGGFDLGGGDGGFGELLIELLLWIILSLPFPWNLIVLAIIGAILWFAGKEVRTHSGLNRIPSPARVALMADAIDPAFLHRNPGFRVEPFRARVRTAFLAIQQAWSVQDLAPVRRWISDGVWQRFHTQFLMMRELEQTNRVSAVEVRKIFLDRTEQDGGYDLIHVGIHFTARDDFVSAKYPALDQTGPLELLEYWTFMRRSGVAERGPESDLVHNALCPSCGAPLPDDLGEVARCANCGAVSTLGDYDWVLAEITQADDYANRNARLSSSGRQTERIRDALGAGADFSVQQVEDKASNAYLQIVAARALGQPERLRRFVGDALFGRIAPDIAGDRRLVYNRLYLNDVSLIDHYRQGGLDHLVVALRLTAQRVDVAGGALVRVDHAPYARDEVMILAREVGAGRPRGSLYAHACPACGGPLADTLDLKCGYCGSVVNSPAHEWIVIRLLHPAAYRASAGEAMPALATRVAIDQPDALDPLFKARDYAFNNVLAVLGADGAIGVDELHFAQGVARRLGLSVGKLAGLLALARQRRLPLRLPEDPRTAEKMLRLMEKAAAADGAVSAEERALLDEIGRRIAAPAA